MKQKTVAIFLLIFFILPIQLFSLSEETVSTEVSLDSLIEKHQDRAITALNVFCRFTTDQINVYGTVPVFERDSEAWNLMRKLDSGWFSPSSHHELLNVTCDEWEYISETEFAVNVRGDYKMYIKAACEYITYTCGYRFYFHQTNKAKDEWQVYDFNILENPLDAERAEKFTNDNIGITMKTVIGKTFTGYMLIIDDPSRIFVGTIKYFGKDVESLTIDKLCSLHDALGGINGGGFSEAAGGSGQPSGIVVTRGEMRQKHSYGNKVTGIVIGFDYDDKLIVGNYTREDVEKLNLRDALGFGPALIINGEAQDTNDERNNLSIRTAIGQDAEGRVFMLVTRGRQPDSLGANMRDLIAIFQEYNVITAGNLDGGNSTCMYLNNESVYSGFRLQCSRNMPAGFLIEKIPE